MLSRIIQFSTSRPKRVIALWFVIALALASIGAGFGYKVVTDDTAQFLPKGSESAQAVDFARTAFGQQKGTQTVTMLVKRTDDASLTAGDQAEIRSLAAATRRWRVDTDAPELGKQVGDLDKRAGQVVGAQMGPASPDGRLQLVGLQWKANTTDLVAQEFFRQVRDRAADIARDHDLRVAFTGGVASRADEMKAQEGTRALSQALLFGSVIALSLLFFRGPLAAVVERGRPPGVLGQDGELGDDLVHGRFGPLAGEPTAEGDPGLAFLQGEQGVALPAKVHQIGLPMAELGAAARLGRAPVDRRAVRDRRFPAAGSGTTAPTRLGPG